MTKQQTAYLWQQCTAPDGKVGSWVSASPESKHPISPIFKDTAKLFGWLHANGWAHLPGDCSIYFRNGEK